MSTFLITIQLALAVYIVDTVIDHWDRRAERRERRREQRDRN